MLNHAVMGIFGQKSRQKIAKVFAKGIFYLCLSSLFFTFQRRVNVSNVFLPSFKAVRRFWRNFFQKSGGRRRSKTFFLASRGEQSFVYTSPDRSRYPDIRMSRSQLRIGLRSTRSVRYPAHNATLSAADRKRFQRLIIRISRRSSATRKRGFRVSGCHCACALLLPSTWKRFFLLFATFKNFLSLFSCAVTAQSDLKIFLDSFVNFESLFTCTDRTIFQKSHAI